jgi:rhamnose utilization protein RhaD (predicted bifunctional aldolase and dehydrogenase)
MVNVQRQNLLDTNAPNPSVETLLHAYLPHKFIDHTHSVTSTAIACLPDAEEVCRRIFGRRVGFVPYIMPGFQLAKAAAAVFEGDPAVEGLLLAKHGIFTMAGTAREAYELMIDMVTLMERYVAEHETARPQFRPVALPNDPAPAELVLPVLRGLLAEAAPAGTPTRWLFNHRVSDRILRFVSGRDLRDYGRRGVATPEQVIRIKSEPAILPAAGATDPAGWRAAADAAIADFVARYQAYFERHNQRVGGIKKPLDPLPRVLALPGFGIIGVGKSAAEASISSDVAEAWIDAVLDAEGVGRFESISEADHFDMEYWSLEQAKLGKGAEKRLARHVVTITGGGGAIGSAIARAFAAEGAEVAVLDIDAGCAEATRKTIGGRALALGCDVTDTASVDRAIAGIAEHFGGLDILVSNAGAASGGMMAEMPESVLRGSFELNFFGHQGRRANNAAPADGRRAAVQRLEAGRQSGDEFRRLWHREGRIARARAAICAGAWRRRHSRQCRERRPHPLRPAVARHDRGARGGARCHGRAVYGGQPPWRRSDGGRRGGCLRRFRLAAQDDG